MKSNLVRFCVLGAIAVGMTLGARADTVYDNLTATSSGKDPISSFGPLADSFTTGSSEFTLTTVILDLMDATPADGGAITVTLNSSSSNAPGAVLDTIGTILDTSLTPALADFTLTTSLGLSADTMYWIELTESGPDGAEWSWSLDTSGTGVAGEYFANSNGVFPNTDGPYQMDLEGVEDVTASTPEPSSLLLLGSGLLILAASLRRRLFAGRG